MFCTIETVSYFFRTSILHEKRDYSKNLMIPSIIRTGYEPNNKKGIIRWIKWFLQLFEQVMSPINGWRDGRTDERESFWWKREWCINTFSNWPWWKKTINSCNNQPNEQSSIRLWGVREERNELNRNKRRN